MLTRDSLPALRSARPAPSTPPAPEPEPTARAPTPERQPTTPAPDVADLADTLAALAFDLEAGRLTPGNLAALTDLTLAADDLLGLAAALAPDPWPYLAARAAVGSLPTGADASRPNPWPGPRAPNPRPANGAPHSAPGADAGA